MKKSTDVWFCAFLMFNGKQLESYDVISRGKVECHFNVSEDEWKQYKIDFNKSEFIKFKGLIDQLKDLAY